MPRSAGSDYSDSPFVLFVEGQDDEHVLVQICESAGLAGKFEIRNKDGYSNVVKALTLELKNEHRRAVGFVLDADMRAMDRWAEIRKALAADRAVPECPDPQGTILSGDPTLGLWLMPDNGSSGELEDFVAGLVRENDAVWPGAKAYLDGLPETEREHVEKKRMKATVHVWLANKKRPGRMGAAIGAGHLDVKAEPAVRLVSWLRRLFDDAPASAAAAPAR